MPGVSVKVTLAVFIFIMPVSGVFSYTMADDGAGRIAIQAVKGKPARKRLKPGEIRSLKKRSERESRRHEEEMRRREYEMMLQSQQRGMGGSPGHRQDTDTPDKKHSNP
jgi:hypothetical protein